MTSAERLEANAALYRAELSCRVGKDVLRGQAAPAPGFTAHEWVMYHLLSAVEDLARGLAEMDKSTKT